MDMARFVGLPFGEGPGQVTCWALVRRVHGAMFGTDLPIYGEIAAHDLVRVAREMTAGAARECWAAPEVPAAGDVVLMRSARGGRAVCHVGILVDVARVLHAEEATGSVLVPIDHFTIRNRIAGFRRYVAA